MERDAATTATETAAPTPAAGPTPVAHHGVNVLRYHLAHQGSSDVKAIAKIVSEYPAEREPMLHLLQTQLGNAYVQSVLSAIVVTPPAPGDPPAPTATPEPGAGAAPSPGPSPDPSPVPSPGPSPAPVQGPYPDVAGSVKLMTTPADNHEDWVTQIAHAKHSVFMEMYHLTDEAVVDALITAHNNKCDVKVLLDKTSIDTNKGYKAAYTKLKNAGVQVRESSAGFKIQHSKAMVVDGHTSFVTSINLTNKEDQTRDLGLILEDQRIANEMLSVFNADWENALTGKTDTPELSDPNLLWSPTDSEKGLSGLIDTAKHTIVATVENLDDAEIQTAFLRAVTRGCHVRLIIPEVDEGPNHNWPALWALKNGGVDARVMPYPSTKSHPYMHSKMILVDNIDVYIGSINFSTSSTQKSRELGIVVPRPAIVDSVSATFEGDWTVSITPPKQPPVPSPTQAQALAADAD